MGVIDGGSVMITGASSGLGAEFARQMAPRAKNLILVARDKSKLEDMASELRKLNSKLQVITEACDLSQTDDIERLINSVLAKTQVDVLVNNVGLGDFAFFDKSKWDNDLKMLQVNVIGLTLLTHKLVPLMVERKKGGIINIGSAAGFVSIPMAAIYNATRHYINGFSDSLAIDLAGTGVTVTQVCPGPVSTEVLGPLKPVLSSAWRPNIIKITPQQCAKEAIAGFNNKKAQVVPGFIFRWGIWAFSFLPCWLTRTFGQIASKSLRSNEQKLLKQQVPQSQSAK
jgi:short-subunit dehydrogenase